jgi:filamentous hemagglutinin family protein
MQRQILALVPLLALGFAIAPAKAQIVPSAPTTPGATGTIVTPGSEINITGGQTAGTNLFHSFSQFGLTQGQVANFQTAAEIKNVLARVNGGDPSVINGLLKLTGSNASLYLMNPAGIIFGNYAKINIPGSFVATTATTIGIGSGMFNAIGPNTYTTGTPNNFIFQPGAKGTIVNTMINTSIFDATSLDYNPPSMGERRTLAFIGNTVLDLAGITTAKDNIALFAVPENASLTYIGSQSQIGLVDFNTIVKPSPGETIMNLPTFNAFNIPSLTDLATLSRETDFSYSSNIKTISNDQVTLNNKNNTTIKSGNLYSADLRTHTYHREASSEIGSITLLSDQSVIVAGVIAANNIYISGKTIQSTLDATAPGIGIYVDYNMQGKTISLSAEGNIEIPSTIAARSSLYINTAGDVQVGGLKAVVPLGTARGAAEGNISVRANTLRVTNTRSFVAGFENEQVTDGAFTEYSSRFSILASGSINIEQTGQGQFIEAAGLERDASGSVVYRLASNPETRVTIVGVNHPAENLIPDSAAAGFINQFRNTVTGELTPYNDNYLVLKNVATGELIQNDRVMIRSSNNPASLSGGGTKGLIGRLDKSSGFLAELSGTTKPTLPAPSLDTQPPAMISVTSEKGGTSLANPIAGALPGSYSNAPIVVTPPPVVVTVIPSPPPQNNIPATLDPVLSSAAIAPSPITQLPTETTPTATKATPAPTQSEIVLYHRPVLSSNATRATLDTGILKVEIDPREEGILTLYRQPIGAPTIQQTSQSTAQKEEPKN